MFLFPSVAVADTAETMPDTSDLESVLDQLDEAYSPYVEDFSLRELWDELQQNGGGGMMERLWELLRSLLFGRMINSTRLLAQLLALAVLSILLSVLKDSFGGAQVSQLAQWIVSLTLLGIAITIFGDASVIAHDAISTMSDLMMAILPVLLPLLAALGGVSTVALISPALLMAMNVLMSVMKNLVLPLIWLFAMLKLAHQLAPRFPMSRLAGLCKDVAMGVMSVVTTLFISVLSISGLASATRDGVGFKAAKTAAGAFIPVVGRTLADAMDSVMGTVLVVKGAVGVVGAVALVLICAVPAVQLLTQAILFRLAGALVQPLGDDVLAEALSGMGNSLVLLFAAVAICSLFAFFSLALMLTLGSITMMMR